MHLEPLFAPFWRVVVRLKKLGLDLVPIWRAWLWVPRRNSWKGSLCRIYSLVLLELLRREEVDWMLYETKSNNFSWSQESRGCGSIRSVWASGIFPSLVADKAWIWQTNLNVHQIGFENQSCLKILDDFQVNEGVFLVNWRGRLWKLILDTKCRLWSTTKWSRKELDICKRNHKTKCGCVHWQMTSAGTWGNGGRYHSLRQPVVVLCRRSWRCVTHLYISS